MQTSWARFRRQEGLSQGWMPLPGKHCCCLKHLFPLGIPAGATRWQSCEAKDPRAGRLESESPQAEITAKFTFWQLWSLKAKETSSLSKTIPLLQPGPYHLNKPGIPLPIKLLWSSIYLSTYPSIHLHTHPHIQPSKYLWKRSMYQALCSALEIQQWTDRSRIHSQWAYVLLGKGEH